MIILGNGKEGACIYTRTWKEGVHVYTRTWEGGSAANTCTGQSQVRIVIG